MKNFDFPETDEAEIQRQRDRVSEHDKFRFAKTILLISLITYIAFALLYLFGDVLSITGPVKQVWSLTSQAFFGIVNLLIGFYFGDRIAKES